MIEKYIMIVMAMIMIALAANAVIVNEDPNQAFGGIGEGIVINLSGTEPGIFEGSLFAKDGIGGGNGVSLNPSQKEFLEDRGEGVPIGNTSPKMLRLGLIQKMAKENNTL